jgi:hypothetical protein
MGLSSATIDHPGIVAGRADALAGLVAARGDSVIAYVLELSGEDTAGLAAAEAMARFRAAITTLGSSSRVETDTLLLAATRHAAAAAADLDRLWRSARIQERDPNCERMPTMLAARAVGQINAADMERVARHLWRCEGCRLVEAAFSRAEAAYREPMVDPEPHETDMMIAALQSAAPITATPPEPVEPVPEAEEGHFDREHITDHPAAKSVPIDAVFDLDSPAHEAHLLEETQEHDTLGEEYQKGRSATFAFGALAMLAVAAVIAFSIALAGLPGQDDDNSDKPVSTTTGPAADPSPTTPATR